MELVYRSDIGFIRETNEDSVVVFEIIEDEGELS